MITSARKINIPDSNITKQFCTQMVDLPKHGQRRTTGCRFTKFQIQRGPF